MSLETQSITSNSHRHVRHNSANTRLIKKKSSTSSVLMLRKTHLKDDHYFNNSNHKQREKSMPESDTILDLAKLGHDDNTELRKALIPLINAMLPSWKDVSHESHIGIERVGGALTNCVFFVTKKLQEPSQAKPSKVLLRVYGNGVDQLFDRRRELYFLEMLSKLSIGPELLGIFKNGRFEQHLESVPLRKDDLRVPETSRTIAKRMFQLHNIINKFPPPHDTVPEVWSNIDKWYQLALKARYTEKQRQDLKEFDFELLSSEIKELKTKLAKLNSPMVLAHNDTQCGNILRLTNGNLVVVDFEYTGYNYRGFDIANHFCEWMYDYHSSESHKMHLDWYPTKEQQINFLKSYIQIEQNFTTSSSLLSYNLQKLMTEVDAFTLASHVMWGEWGLIQSGQSHIEFDYFGFAMQRLKRFRESKKSIYHRL